MDVHEALHQYDVAGNGGVFVYTMFVVWFLEHRSNQDFRGPWKSQLGTTMWFTISTLFFAHKERLQSNFSRSVILVWLFIVFILRFSYIANLPTMLTVERLHSHSTDIDYLRKNNSKVGCDGDSFILTYLKEVLHFLPENIMEIPSEYSYPDALNNGSSFSGAPLRESLPLQILRRIQGYGTDLQIWRPWVCIS